jgi:hypothetical protein
MITMSSNQQRLTREQVRQAVARESAFTRQEIGMHELVTRRIPSRSVTITVLADGSVTVARAEMNGTAKTMSAKREPGDKPDAAIGEDLATARALAALARTLERRARGRIRNADAIKTHRRERKEQRIAGHGTNFSGLKMPVGTVTRGKSRGEQIEIVPVSELFVRCSYPQRPDAKEASDTCQDIANTAVQDDEGRLLYRCPAHEGQLSPGSYSEVIPSIPRERRLATTRKQDRK